MPKNIVIFSDGTGQLGGVNVDEHRSNIYKLYRATRCGPDSCINPAEQVAFYDPGLGSRPLHGGGIRSAWTGFHNFLSQATGFGLTTNIIDCVEAIYRLWRPGDRIFLFGFSRGAYTVRCVGGVLALCGVPTQLEHGAAMRYDAGTARRLATLAVKKVYQHTASRTPTTLRQKELIEQRAELACQFRDAYASRQADTSEYPYFIGVFDTVAAVASRGSLIALSATVVALTAAVATLSWYFQPAWVINWTGLDAAQWRHWFAFVVGGLGVIALAWYARSEIKFAPRANRKRWWRTFTISFRRMHFEDKSLNDNVKYARHAIAIDENRASFRRVEWDPKAGRSPQETEGSRPYQDGDQVITFRQYWFAGNHSDIGGSYPENESRLSDIALKWMADEAARVRNGLKIDRSVLRLYPAADGMQHDERRSGFSLLTRIIGFTWREERRKIKKPDTTLHESVYDRFKLGPVMHYDREAPYLPETLRHHAKLSEYYRDISEPSEPAGLRAYIRSFFLPDRFGRPSALLRTLSRWFWQKANELGARLTNLLPGR